MQVFLVIYGVKTSFPTFLHMYSWVSEGDKLQKQAQTVGIYKRNKRNLNSIVSRYTVGVLEWKLYWKLQHLAGAQNNTLLTL